MIKYRGRFNDDVTGSFYTEYDLVAEHADRDSGEACIRFMQQVKASSLAIAICWVTEEDVERDMQNVSGTYDLNSLIDDYRMLVRNASKAGDLVFSIHFASSKHGSGVIFLYPRLALQNLFVMSKKDYLAIDDLLDMEVDHTEQQR